jgi:thermolysin
MDNPHAASNAGYTADDDPDHYSEKYTGTGDNGGVHINSGIANKAFYLLAKGGAHHLGGSMTGIGADDAAKIWYLAMANYMTSSTNFAGARTATRNAAAALFGSGSAKHTAVGTAWSLCGVN